MKTYKLVTFDFDGTLCDTAPAIISTLQQLFPGTEQTQIDAQLSVGTPLKSVIAQLHQHPLSATELDALCHQYRALYNQEHHQLQVPFPHARDTIMAFRQAGAQCLIVSNKGEAALNAFVQQYAFTSLFDDVIGERVGIAGKPHPDVYEQVIRPAYPGIKPEHILHIGDTTADLAFAHAIGADSAYLTHGFGDDEAALAMQPTWYCSHFEALSQQLALGGQHV
ncbi:HAD family hydrolase [Pseudoalteromonas rubra]|uniref:HAD family hydrolase n=1 Tax=Pseudoalteromonas rubra TaxID=43658 RepID=UPI000F7720AF|nr:HAD family hydrolase [Pseudoalteromonas rubra]